MVIRPLDKLLPSSWQQRVKSARETLTLDDWLREVLERPGGWKGPTFWKNQGVDNLVERYAVVVPRDRITLIVSDETDRTQQMRTFEALLGLPSPLLTPGDHQNTSLSLDRTELLRQVNVLAAEREWSESIRRALIHGGMLSDLRRAPAEEGERAIPGLPLWAADRVAALNRERADQVRGSGCRVVGDPAMLAAPPSSAAPEPLPEQVSLRLAAASVAGVVDAVRRRERHRKDGASDRQAPEVDARTLDAAPSRALMRELGGRVRHRLVTGPKSRLGHIAARYRHPGRPT
jgi:hypothetical protein